MARAPSANKTSGDAGIASTRLAATADADAGPDAARRALGAFVRRMRDRAAPGPAARTPGRRRAAGLRREEVALAAGISVTWYTWLEQARPVRVSAPTLAAIARALGLDATERAHLRRLAAAAARSTRGARGSGAARAARLTTRADEVLRAVVDALAPHAAYAVNGRWDVLHANRAAVALLGDFAARPGVTDNVLTRLFLDADWRGRFAHADAVAAAAAAQFRAATGHLAGDAAWAAFVARLADASEGFRACWARHALAPAAAWEKVVCHPTAGALRLRYASLAPDAAPPDVRVIVYLPADEATAERLARVRA